MPPKAPPAETADAADNSVATEVIAQARKSGYEAGYADGHKFGYAAGLADGKPKPNLFEAAKGDVQRLSPHMDEAQALGAIREIMDRRSAEYGDKIPSSDRDLLLAVWRRKAIDARREQARPEPSRQPAGQHSSRDPFEGEPVVEYEVVS